MFNKLIGSVYYGTDYDTDVLYSGDQNLIDAYYSVNKEREERYYERTFMYILKERQT